MNELVPFDHLCALAANDVAALVARALALRGGAAPERFDGRALGLLFFNPSLRTQASFQRAAGLLGLQTVLHGSTWPLETDDGAVMDGDKAEHVKEAARVLSRYVDVLGVRAFAEGKSLERDATDPLFQGFARHATVPVVNLESARWHPCQALADWTTLDQHAIPRRARFVLSWAYHPKALPQAVPNSTLCMAAQRGMDVVLLRPDGYDLAPGVVAEARSLAARSGGSLTVTSDRDAALAGASIVYAKSWGSLAAYGDAAAETALRSPHRDWCVRESWFDRAEDGARFMHCLPVRRNVVVADEVIDSPRALVIEQAENRLWAQTAVLEAVLSNSRRAGPAPRALPDRLIPETSR